MLAANWIAQLSRINKLLPLMGRLLKEESGQGTAEYILILSASVLGTVQLSKIIISNLDKAVLHLGAILEQDLKTGRAPASVWEN